MVLNLRNMLNPCIRTNFVFGVVTSSCAMGMFSILPALVRSYLWSILQALHQPRLHSIVANGPLYIPDKPLPLWEYKSEPFLQEYHNPDSNIFTKLRIILVWRDNTSITQTAACVGFVWHLSCFLDPWWFPNDKEKIYVMYSLIASRHNRLKFCSS